MNCSFTEKSSTTSTTKAITRKIQVFIDFEKDIDMKKVFGTGRVCNEIENSFDLYVILYITS